MDNNQIVTNAKTPPKVTNKKATEGKFSLLIFTTFVLGILSIVSLIFVLKAKKGDMSTTSKAEVPTEEIVSSEKMAETVEIEDDELRRQKLLKELDQLDFDAISEVYSEN